MKALWKKARVVAPGSCKGCRLAFEKGEWAYLSPEGKAYCLHCTVDRGATVEKSPQVQANLDRVVSRFFDFVAGEMERKIKK